MVNVRQNLVSSLKYALKCPFKMDAEFFVVHNTANDASADAEVKYMIGNLSSTSFHYAVDDKEVVQGLPTDRNSWNASDGTWGDGNRKGISVEICYSKSGGDIFDVAEVLASKFIAQELVARKWGLDRIKKHQDFYSKKYCPHRTLDKGWQRFLNMIQTEIDILTKPVEQPKPQPSINQQVLQLQQVINRLLKLGISEDGISGSQTKNATIKLQQVLGLSADGIAGSQTWGAINSVLAKPLLKVGVNGVPTRYLQWRLGILSDGIFGNGTKNAVIIWQSKNALSADGIVGNQTWNMLIG